MDDIRTINGKYTESARHLHSYFWDTQQFTLSFDKFRPAINLNTLIALLKPSEEEQDDEGGNHNGEGDNNDEAEQLVCNKRRRAASTFPLRSKKRRLIGGDCELNADMRSESSDHDSHECEDHYRQNTAFKQIYPSIWEEGHHKYDEPSLDPASQFLPVFKSSLEICYVKSAQGGDDHSFVTDRAAKKLGWLKEEEDLLALFNTLCSDQSQPQTFDLGRFWIQNYRTRLLALSGEPEPPRSPCPKEFKEKSERWFFLLPQVPWPDGLSKVDIEDKGVHYSPVHEDLLEALFTFQSLGRAKVETNVQLITLPQGSYDPAEELPFRLHAQLNVSIVVPGLYRPFDDRKISQKQVSELEGLQRRLITLFAPESLNQSLLTVGHDQRGDASIPFFYGILCPAPVLPQGETYRSLQPEDLLPTLLPFQRRTVAWMLRCERKLMPQEGNGMPPFWKKISLGGREHFFNTLTTAVSPSPPESNAALGGILAEEPGTSLHC